MTKKQKEMLYELLFSRSDIIREGNWCTASVLFSLMRDEGFSLQSLGYTAEEKLLRELPEFLDVKPGEGPFAGVMMIRLHNWRESKPPVTSVPEKKPFTDAVKAQIYALLRGTYEVGAIGDPAVMGKLLRANGILFKDYGFASQTALLQAMPAYVEVKPIEMNGKQQQRVILLDCQGGCSAGSPEPASVETAVPEKKPFTEEIKAQIYALLQQEYSLGDVCDPAVVGNLLRNQNICFENFGFPTLTKMLHTMEPDYLELREVDIHGPQKRFVLKRKEIAAPPAAPASVKKPAAVPSAGARVLDDAEKARICALMLDGWLAEYTPSKAMFGKKLKNSGILYEDYGFDNLTDFITAFGTGYLLPVDDVSASGATVDRVKITYAAAPAAPAAEKPAVPAAATPAGEPMTVDALKQTICRLLKREAGLDSEYPAARLGQMLSQDAIDVRKIAGTGLVSLLRTMEDCGITVRDRLIGGVSHSYVTLHTTTGNKTIRLVDEEDEAFSSRLLDETEKRKIYALLRNQFPVNEELHMATVNLYLFNNGYKKELYGFRVAKDFLKALEKDFLQLDERPMNGVEQTLVTIREVLAWNTELGEDIPFPRSLFDSNMEISDDFRRALSYQRTGRANKDMTEALKVLDEDYRKAVREEKGLYEVRTKQGPLTYRFDTELCDAVGRPLEAYIMRADAPDTWTLVQVSRKRELMGEKLLQYAKMDFEVFLEELADLALKERWGEKEGDYSILSSYIRYTFDHLEREDKICESRDHKFSAFHTGLVDEMYDDIYACFHHYLNKDGTLKFREFAGFCTSSNQSLGKGVGISIYPLPQPASYLKKKEDLLFDPDLELMRADDHILVDNIHRLPLGFVRKYMTTETALLDRIECIPERSKMKDAELKHHPLYAQLRVQLKENRAARQGMRNKLSQAIEIAKRKVRWNYKTATPSYYPTDDVMGFLLPLALEDDNATKADTALVVRMYQVDDEHCVNRGETILTLRQAYRNARLVCRPDSDWLNMDVIRQN